MLRILMHAAVAVGCLGLTGMVASAQEVIHAMTGTIRTIDAAQQMFTLFGDTGSLVTFETEAKVGVAIDKKTFPDATAARDFDTKDAYVIVYYYGRTDNPTAVAVQALGRGPFTATVGTVASFSGRLISVKDESGSIHNYKINAATVAESDSGVVEGRKFHAEKGDHVRVVGAVSDDNPTAVFVNVM
jgi:hypothetical protein